MKKLLLASALTALTFTAAQAADAVVYEPVAEAPIATAYDWSGAYVGVQAGYGWGKGRYISLGDNQSASPRPDGALGGLYAGYNHQSGQWVYGLEADFNFHSASDIRTFSPDPKTNSKFDMDWSGSVRARLGYAIDKFMPFITGGVAFGRISHDWAHSNPVPRVSREIFRGRETGWTIGAGLEVAATENILTRIEYRYSDFGSRSFPATSNSLRHTMEFKTHDLRLGIAYKF